MESKSVTTREVPITCTIVDDYEKIIRSLNDKDLNSALDCTCCLRHQKNRNVVEKSSLLDLSKYQEGRRCNCLCRHKIRSKLRSLLKPGHSEKTHQFKCKLLNKNAKVPTKGSEKAAGYDLYVSEEVTVPKRGRALVKTGVAFSLPDGYYGRIAPRSGLAWKHGLDVGAGVGDQDYRGEVFVVIFNHSDTDYTFKIGDRAAQFILTKIGTCDHKLVVVKELDETKRSDGGLGSTGK